MPHAVVSAVSDPPAELAATRVEDKILKKAFLFPL